MGELWRRVSELIWKQPLLLVPVLVADLLGFLVNLERVSSLQALVLGRMQYRSALGGAPVHMALSGSALEHTTILVLLLNWVSYFVRMLLYAAALIATAALVRKLATARNPPSGIGSALRQDLAGIFSLSLRSLAIFAVAGLILDSIALSVVRHGHKVWLTRGWLDLGVGVLLFAALAFILAPAALRVLTRRLPLPATRRQAEVLAFLLGIASLLLGRFVAANIRSFHSTPVARFLLELTGSWIVALPYAIFFVALGLLASDTERASD